MRCIILFYFYFSFFFLPIKMVADSTFLRHANSIPPLYPSFQSGSAMGNTSPEKQTTHIFYIPSEKNNNKKKKADFGDNEQRSTGQKCTSFKKLRGYVGHNLSLSSQGRLFVEPFIHQTVLEHLLCLSVALLGAGVMETEYPVPVPWR